MIYYLYKPYINPPTPWVSARVDKGQTKHPRGARADLWSQPTRADRRARKKTSDYNIYRREIMSRYRI